MVARFLCVAGMLCALLPAAAHAQNEDEDGCTSEDLVEIGGRCDSRRPLPEAWVEPALPHAGSPVTLRVESRGRGLSFAWDTDGDGAHDDGTGAELTRSFAAGERIVRVLATDEDGRTGSASVSFDVHEQNLRPTGQMWLLPSTPRVGEPIDVTVNPWDSDGRVVRIDLDLDGDGVYESQHAPEPYLETTTTLHTAGVHTLRFRIVDDTGATTVGTTQVEVHAANLPPIASVFVDPTIELRAGDDVEIHGFGHDPDGRVVKAEFDLDGDGSYETNGPINDVVVKRFATAGTHIVGLRVTDRAGAQGFARRSIEITGPPPVGNRAPSVELLLPPGLGHPGAQLFFSAFGRDPDGDPVSFAWDIDGDGAFDDGTGQSVNFTYAQPGTYEVRLRASDGKGGERTSMQTMLVVPEAGLPPVLQ